MFNYLLNNITYNIRTFSVKNLGIHFSSDLFFKTNYEIIISKSHKTLGFINRKTKTVKNITSIKTLHCSLVCFVLKFGFNLYQLL